MTQGKTHRMRRALSGSFAFFFFLAGPCATLGACSSGGEEAVNQLDASPDAQLSTDGAGAAEAGMSDGVTGPVDGAAVGVGDGAIQDDGAGLESGCGPLKVCVEEVCVPAYCRGECGAVEIPCGGDCECFCDEECFELGDCCPDICVSCGDMLGGLCGKAPEAESCD